MTWQDKLRESLPTAFRRNHQAKIACDACEILGVTVNRIAEIGVYKGVGSRIFAERYPDACLTLIDPWKADPDCRWIMYRNRDQDYWDGLCQQVCDEFAERHNTAIVRGLSVEVAGWMNGWFDLVFLDGDHSEQAVRDDIAAWLPKVRPGGILAGHDYSVHGRNRGVKKAVDDLLGEGNVVVGARKTWVHQVQGGA